MALTLVAGGRSTEHDASLHSYDNVVAELGRELPAIVGRVVYVDRDGSAWLHRAVPSDAAALTHVGGARRLSPEELLGVLRVAPSFSLLFGTEGEDGSWQGVAEVFDLVGNFGPVDVAALAMNKFAFAAAACAADKRIAIPSSRLVRTQAPAAELASVAQWLDGSPCVVKPNSLGASLLLSYLESPDAGALVSAVAPIAEYDRLALVQRFVPGPEYTVGILEGAAGPAALPVVCAHTDSLVLGHAEKHRSNLVRAEVVDHGRAQLLRDVSLHIFEAFGFRLWCRFDFRWPEEAERPVLLEANAMPGLMRGSAYPLMLAAAGLGVRDLLLACLDGAAHGRGRRKDLRYRIEPHDVPSQDGEPQRA